MIFSLNSNFIFGESLQLGFLNTLLVLKQTISGNMAGRDWDIDCSHPHFVRGTQRNLDWGTQSNDDNSWFPWLKSKKRAARSAAPKVQRAGQASEEQGKGVVHKQENNANQQDSKPDARRKTLDK
ncbi:hypothetical protein Dsin_023296 [Dipteronia sinensis]|uniref:Uncharacterized protein n=1 Tax=Dipteronia sinensis TaxID=43782 RepID=A0AAE0A4N2_9ROSI|nr:hypothetical protein Dsin_023296 [Dipteronia sinensis]